MPPPRRSPSKSRRARPPTFSFRPTSIGWTSLQKKNLIDVASRQTLLGNTLILIAPKDSTVSLSMEKNLPLLKALGPEGKLAMANVDSVPAGRYGKAALIYFGVWDDVAPRVAQADNVRAAWPSSQRARRRSELSTEPTRRRSLRSRRRHLPRGKPSENSLPGCPARTGKAGGARFPAIPLVARSRPRLRGARLLHREIQGQIDAG